VWIAARTSAEIRYDIVGEDASGLTGAELVLNIRPNFKRPYS